MAMPMKGLHTAIRMAWVVIMRRAAAGLTPSPAAMGLRAGATMAPAMTVRVAETSMAARDLALILLSTQCFSMGLSVRRAASEACLADHRQNSILPQRKGFLWRRARSRNLERIH